MSTNPIDDFVLTSSDFSFVGEDLQRPECILAEPDGTLWAADARGGVVRIDPDGTQDVIAQTTSPDELTVDNAASRLIDGTLPNGLAFDRNGDILISNFGTDRLERMTRDGHTTPILEQLDGEPIGKVNFVSRDSHDRIWVTVSTKIHDWAQAMLLSVHDGQVLLCDEQGGVRIVADGLAFANECRLDATEEWLYVAQTSARNIIRFRIQDDGSLTDREIYGPEDHGRPIDGITFDAHGNLWGTYVVADGIFAITPERELRLIFDDTTPEQIALLQQHQQAGTLDMQTMLTLGGPIATWCASLTFGGPDLRTVYVGSLRQSRIPYFQAPVAGLPLVHWNETHPTAT